MNEVVVTEEAQARLARVGLVVNRSAPGTVRLEVDPEPPPVVDRWTLGRAAVWAVAGRVGLDRGTAYMCAAPLELVELQWGRQIIDTVPNRAADLVAAAAGYELGRHMRARREEGE